MLAVSFSSRIVCSVVRQVALLAECCQSIVLHIMIPLVVIEMRNGKDYDLAGLLLSLPVPSCREGFGNMVYSELLRTVPRDNAVVEQAAMLASVLGALKDPLAALLPVSWVVSVVDWHQLRSFVSS